MLKTKDEVFKEKVDKFHNYFSKKKPGDPIDEEILIEMIKTASIHGDDEDKFGTFCLGFLGGLQTSREDVFFKLESTYGDEMILVDKKDSGALAFLAYFTEYLLSMMIKFTCVVNEARAAGRFGSNQELSEHLKTMVITKNLLGVEKVKELDDLLREMIVEDEE